MFDSEKKGAVLNITQEQLQEILRTVLTEANRPNALEQRKLDEELERERKRNLFAVELGKIEEARMKARRDGCSHMRDSKGNGVPRGYPTGEWTTSGQAMQDGTAALICMRCSTTWILHPSPEQYSAIVQNGLLGVAPPLAAA